MLTSLQKQVIAVIAKLRDEGSYLAGGAVLNQLTSRVSDDLDVFLDDERLVLAVARRDIEALRAAGFVVVEDMMLFGFAEATINAAAGDATKIQWMSESAYRFFPLQKDAELGFRLHDVDLAVNKAIAGASRKKARDIVDLAMIDERYMQLGALVWAAAGGKTAMSPIMMLDNIVHNAAVHSPIEYRMLRSIEPIDGAAILARIQTASQQARDFCRAAPVETLGHVFLGPDARPVAPTIEEILRGRVHAHAITERGAWPSFPDADPQLPGAG